MVVKRIYDKRDLWNTKIKYKERNEYIFESKYLFLYHFMYVYFKKFYYINFSPTYFEQ